jgi:uncharacterized membrane protein
MSVYWTKERIKNILVAFISFYVMLVGFFTFVAWISNDLSSDLFVKILVVSLLMDMLALCVATLGALIKYTGHSAKKEEITDDTA